MARNKVLRQSLRDHLRSLATGVRISTVSRNSQSTSQPVNQSTASFTAVTDCSHFKFVFSNGHADLDADANTLEKMIADARMVSNALASAGNKRQFSVHDHHEELITHFHHEWPPADDN